MVTTTESTTTMRHILVVGGTRVEWESMPSGDWDRRVAQLQEVCADRAVRWLTLRPYRNGSAEAPTRGPRVVSDPAGCTVIVDDSADGRQRFADAMQRLDPSDEVNEASVAAVLYEPADSEPDMVVVLGEPTQLPPSLVWELAYAELVFIPVAWADLSARVLVEAFDDFSARRRRFGGLDEESE